MSSCLHAAEKVQESFFEIGCCKDCSTRSEHSIFFILRLDPTLGCMMHDFVPWRRLSVCRPFIKNPSKSCCASSFYRSRRFGFANPRALAAGQTGTACRGEEHDITLVWSVTSGKRLVLADGKEVHYSHSRNSIFDYSWTIRGNHVLKIVAHAAPPMAMTPGFRQYDFFVNGQSFFSMPKLYRLGLAPGDPRAVASPTSPAALAERGNRYSERENIAEVEAPHNPDEVRFLARSFTLW